MTGKNVRIELIDIPDEYEREESLVSKDDPLFKSVKKHGIQQPLNLLGLKEGRYGLIKGGRRLAIARSLGLVAIPAVIDELPQGEDPKRFRNRIRFILDEHQQDLFPSQRAALIRQLMSMFQMKQKDVASYLGVDPGSITLWMKIEDYAPQIVKAIDTGETTLHAARALDGLEAAQQVTMFRKHRKEFSTVAGRKLRRLIGRRSKPAKKSQKRRKPKLTKSEKDILARDLTLKEVELEDGKEELHRLNRAITLATPVIRAVLRDEELTTMLPTEMKPELERFAEVYI
jgi:ParB/RepB/Spo0J family partition protein